MYFVFQNVPQVARTTTDGSLICLNEMGHTLSASLPTNLLVQGDEIQVFFNYAYCIGYSMNGRMK